MSWISALRRNAVVLFAFTLASVAVSVAQSDVNQLVRSQQEGNNFHIYIDHNALDMFGDSVIGSINADSDATWNTWSDVLTNGNSPGMDVNFDGNTAYGIDSLIVVGAAEMDSTLRVNGYVRLDDSLYVALYAFFQSKLAVGDSLIVAGGTDLNGTLDVAGAAGIDGSFDVAGTMFTVDASNGNTAVAGTLSVTGTSSSATGSTVGTLTLADGSITDSSGALSFGDENVSTTGTVSAATGSTVGTLTLADGSITDSSGALSFGDENVSTTGTLGAGNTTITGTLGVSGATGVDGNFDVATNKFTVDATNGNTAVAGTLTVTGAATLNSSLDLNADLDADGTDIDLDATNDISLDAGAASNFTTSAGALTLAGAGGVTVTSTGGTLALNGAGQTVDLDATTLDVDATTITVDATTTTFTGDVKGPKATANDEFVTYEQLDSLANTAPFNETYRRYKVIGTQAVTVAGGVTRVDIGAGSFVESSEPVINPPVPADPPMAMGYDGTDAFIFLADPGVYNATITMEMSNPNTPDALAVVELVNDDPLQSGGYPLVRTLAADSEKIYGTSSAFSGINGYVNLAMTFVADNPGEMVYLQIQTFGADIDIETFGVSITRTGEE